jgi:hypothetical protein
MKKTKSIIDQFELHFITDKKGNKEYVMLKVEDYRQLIEDYQDLALISQRRKDERVSFEDFEKKLKADGRL